MKLKLRALKIDYSNHFWQDILCSGEESNYASLCWKNDCERCSNGQRLSAAVEKDMGANVYYNTWEKVAGEKGDVLQVVTKECCVGELLERVTMEMQNFQEHVRVKRIQEAEFENDKKAARVLQIDFAMAYQCEYQDEVQSALWSRQSVTLFTAAVFHCGETKSLVICSDTKNKDKTTVLAFLFEVYEKFIEHVDNSSIDEIIYSDGPSSEFKNKYMMKAVYMLSAKYNKNFQWKYFATSHGKGVVDGIGGRAKSLVRQAVMSKTANNVIVQNAADFARVAAEKMVTTTVLLIAQSQIDDINTSINAWEEVPAVPGIHRMHVVQSCLHDDTVKLWHTGYDSASDTPLVVQYERRGTEVGSQANEHEAELQSTLVELNQPATGSWCLVQYDGSLYPGEVKSVIGDEYEVSVMMKSGKYYRWPDKPDQLYYQKEDVVRIIQPPEPVGSKTRSQYCFADLE